MNINLSSYVVSTVDGHVDVVATLNKFHDDLTSFAEAERADHDLIEKAVNSAFEKHGSPLTKELLVAYAMHELASHPDDWRTFKPKLMTYLSNKNKFESVKGKGGGISRR